MNAQMVDRLAWTLMHFLWQGALIAMLVAAFNAVVSRSSWRYSFHLAALGLMLAAPLLTFQMYSSTTPPAFSALSPVSGGVVAVHSADAIAGPSSPVAWTLWVVLAWFAGVFVCSIRLAVGWRLTRRMIRMAQDNVPDAVRDAFDRMTQALGLHGRLQLRASPSRHPDRRGPHRTDRSGRVAGWVLHNIRNEH